MEVKALALRALKEIIDEKSSYQVVLERILGEYNLSNEDKKLLRLDVLGSLRHFYFLRFEITTNLQDYDEDADEVYLMIVALHEIRYHSRKIALYQTIESTIAANDFMGLSLSAETIAEKLNYLSTHKTRIPEELKKDPYAYNSLFFSLPLWLIRMWARQYGDEQTMNILLSSQRRASQWLRVNELKTSRESFAGDPRFTESGVCPTALLYNVAGPCSELDEVRQGLLYVQDLSLQYVLAGLEYPFQARALHVGALTGGVTAGLAIALHGKNGTVDALFGDEKRYRRGKYLLARVGAKNAQCYLGPLKILKTYFPYGEHDLVVVTPPSSCLGQLQKRPDVALSIKESDLKGIIAGERSYLREAAGFVCSGGQLVYSVQTMNTREGEQVVKDFLTTDPEFKLVEERQIFPSDYQSDGLYYAVMRRL